MMPTDHLLVASPEIAMPTTQIDAIIVPASRPSGHLASAIELAKKTESFIIVLCSGKITSSEAYTAMSRANVRGAAMDIPARYSHDLLDGFATGNFPEALYGRSNNDLSLKRNLGLLIGHLAGWEKLFFFDDDLTGVGDEELLRAVALLDGSVVGFVSTDFPDNSVVRHAERLTGKNPAIYMSGSALVVDIKKAVGFFPNIYNEDWFFLYDNLSNARVAGTIRQQPFNPFGNPLRAVSEEFGDLLAEGIVQMRDEGLNCAAATEDDWRSILAQRADLIHDIRQDVVGKTDPMKTMAVAALLAAEERLKNIDASLCVRYIEAWRKDVELWQNRLGQIPTHLSLKEAAKLLTVEGVIQESHSYFD